MVRRQRNLQGDAGMELQHSHRREAVKGVGTGGSEGDGEPPLNLQAQAHARIQTLSGKLTATHKSLSLTAVSG